MIGKEGLFFVSNAKIFHKFNMKYWGEDIYYVTPYKANLRLSTITSV